VINGETMTLTSPSLLLARFDRVRYDSCQPQNPEYDQLSNTSQLADSVSFRVELCRVYTALASVLILSQLNLAQPLTMGARIHGQILDESGASVPGRCLG